MATVGLASQVRRDGRLAFRMPMSSKHGLNYVVNVAASIVTPVRMPTTADVLFLLHPEDEAYVAEHAARMNESHQRGSRGTERAMTDFSARKSKFARATSAT